MLKIVFIDDGINLEFIPPGVKFENYTADEGGVFLSEPVSVMSHGTLCFQIFNNNTCAPYQLVSIKVLDNKTGTGNHKALLSALNWCCLQNFHVINLSMGTRQYTDFTPVAAAINKISNTVIVSACSNENEFTFPACLPRVIGVRHSPLIELAGNFAYLQNPYDQVEVITCVKDEPVCFGENETRNMSGSNSFAAPLITARVCDYISNYTGENIRKYVRKQLQAHSVKDMTFTTYEFYKNRKRIWEECEVPIVAVADFTTEANSRLKQLLRVFVNDGYRAVALSCAQNTNAANFVFNLNWRGAGEITARQLMDLYYNFTLPDILFLQTEKQITNADVLLKFPSADFTEYSYIDEKYMLDFTKSAKRLFREIETLLT